MKTEDTHKKSAMSQSSSAPRTKAAAASNPAAKRRVKITLPAGKPRAAKPVAAAKPAAKSALKPAATGAGKSRKPAAQRQLINVTKPRARKPALEVPRLLLEGVGRDPLVSQGEYQLVGGLAGVLLFFRSPRSW